MNCLKNKVKMDVEIQVAVQFIISFLNEKVKQVELDNFCNELRSLLSRKFDGHWYPEKPAKGSAYRCLSIEKHLDAVLLTAAENSSIGLDMLSKYLPKKLDLWIDPTEVSYRIGEHGMVIMIYKEGDDCVNSTSEYLAKVLNQLPTVTEKESPKKSEALNKSTKDQSTSLLLKNQNNLSQQLVHNINMSVNQRRINNHLSPSAKSFVSRKNGMLNLPFNLRSLRPNLNPLINLEYLQKLQNWPLFAAANGGYDPLAAQLLQNYLVVQELQRFETQRLALQSHLLKMQNLQRWSRKQHSHNHNHRQHNQPSTNSNKGLQVTV